jgi:hypothetical protein
VIRCCPSGRAPYGYKGVPHWYEGAPYGYKTGRRRGRVRMIGAEGSGFRVFRLKVGTRIGCLINQPNLKRASAASGRSYGAMIKACWLPTWIRMAFPTMILVTVADSVSTVELAHVYASELDC